MAVPLGGSALDGADASLGAAVAATLAKVVAFLAFMLIIGRRAVPWLLGRVARTGSRELSTLGVLAVSVGIAVGAAVLFDVSFALGAFFAGVVIAESDLNHRAVADALPFQDAFAVLCRSPPTPDLQHARPAGTVAAAASAPGRAARAPRRVPVRAASDGRRAHAARPRRAGGPRRRG